MTLPFVAAGQTCLRPAVSFLVKSEYDVFRVKGAAKSNLWKSGENCRECAKIS